jgi:exonuclease I
MREAAMDINKFFEHPKPTDPKPVDLHPNAYDTIPVDDVQEKLWRNAAKTLDAHAQNGNIPKDQLDLAKAIYAKKPKNIIEQEEATTSAKVLELIMNPERFRRRFSYE